MEFTTQGRNTLKATLTSKFKKNKDGLITTEKPIAMLDLYSFAAAAGGGGKRVPTPEADLTPEGKFVKAFSTGTPSVDFVQTFPLKRKAAAAGVPQSPKKTARRKTEEFPVSEATADEMIAAALGDGDDSGISGAGADHPAIQDMLTGDTADSDARESFSPLPMDGALVNGTLKRKTEETGTKVDPPSEDRHEPPPPRVSLASPSFTPKIRRSTSRNSNSGTRQSGHLASPVAKRASRRIDVESGHPTYDPANANALTNSRDIAGLMRAVLKEELATAVNRIRMELTEGRPIRTGGFRHKALQNGEGGYPFMDDDDGELCVAELATTAGLEAVHSLIEERNVAIAMSEECKEFAEAAVYRAVELTVARDKMDEICNKVQRERDIAIEAQIRSEELVAKLQKENQFLLEALLEKRKANHV